MPLLQILRAVVADPGFSLGIFPDKDLEWKVDSDAWCSQHQWCAGFWVAENQQLGGRHFHSHFGRFSAVINEREQCNSLGLENCLELLDRLFHRVVAGFVNDSAGSTGRHTYLSFCASSFRLLTGAVLRQLE